MLNFSKTYWDSNPCFSRNCIALSEKLVNPVGSKRDYSYHWGKVQTLSMEINAWRSILNFEMTSLGLLCVNYN